MKKEKYGSLQYRSKGFDDAPRHFYISSCEEIRKKGTEPHPLDPAYLIFRDRSLRTKRTGCNNKSNRTGSYGRCGSSGRTDPIPTSKFAKQNGSHDIIGHLKCHVDALEFSGEGRWFEEVWEPLREYYGIQVDDVRCAYKKSYKMTGPWVYQDADYSIRTNQEPYISTLEEIKVKKGRSMTDPLTEQEKKAKMRFDGERMWIGQRSFPSIAVGVGVSVATNNDAPVKDLYYINKLVRAARKLKAKEIQYASMDLDNLGTLALFRNPGFP